MNKQREKEIIERLAERFNLSIVNGVIWGVVSNINCQTSLEEEIEIIENFLKKVEKFNASYPIKLLLFGRSCGVYFEPSNENFLGELQNKFNGEIKNGVFWNKNCLRRNEQAKMIYEIFNYYRPF